MPEIHNKTIHSFSSEDSNFPAKNLLETKFTKKWKCQETGERSCFVIFKLDRPRVISGIDIGNEHSGFIEVLVGNSKQSPPVFKEILLATSFMTIIEANNNTNPNRVRCFTPNALVESVAKEKWDLVKVFCTQPFNNKVKYGLSFVTLHSPEESKSDSSPAKTPQPAKTDKSSEKTKNFGKFSIRANSDSDDDDKTKKKDSESPFNRWKSSKGSQDNKPTIKEQVKTKIEENRKRIRVMTDSSDEEAPKEKVKAKPSRNRMTGLVYEDEDDAPNDKLQKKLDKDKAAKDKEREPKTPKLLVQREKSPGKSKFSAFIDDDVPSASPKPSSSSKSSNDKKNSSSSSSKHSSSSRHSSSSSRHGESGKHGESSSKHSPSSKKHSSSSSPTKKPSSSSSTHKSSPDKKSSSSSDKKPASDPKNVSYKPFNKLLEGVVFAFSGYVNPERGVLRQKALDMGAKYRPDWDSSCTHLICAFANTPKYNQVVGQGKIVTKRWIEACFSEQKKLPWRRYALDKTEKDKPDSEDEIHNILSKPKDSSSTTKESSSSSKSPAKRKISLSDSDDDSDLVVVDKRVKNGDGKKEEVVKEIVEENVKENPKENGVKSNGNSKDEEAPKAPDAMEVSTDDELNTSDADPPENQIFKDKVFFLNEDLSATDVIKLKTQITSMSGKLTDRVSKAGFIITNGKNLPSGISGEILTSLWVTECHEIGGLIPTTRYRVNS